MKKIIVGGLLAVGGYFAWQKWDVSQKRKWVSDWTSEGAWKEIVKRFTDDEVKAVYEFLTLYAPATEADTMKPLPLPLKAAIEQISTKYQIFT
jgi:predicted negative regulator of RcsB-dependent stress response